MKVQLESTEKVVHMMIGGCSVPARMWEGVTESGTPVHCFITRIVPTIGKDDPRQQEFVRELQECRPPSAELAAIPARMIL